MRRRYVPFINFLSLVLIGSSGCEKDPFSAPRPRTVDRISEVEPAKSIYFIVPSEPEGDMLVWAYAAQSEANIHQVVYRLMGPAPGGTPGHEAEIVRRAIADGASSLIVVPDDSPELPKALAEAEARNIPVVLLGRSIPSPAGSKPFTVVDYEPSEISAKQIVATTIEDLKRVGRAVEGTALVVSDQKIDGNTERRVAALKSAASAAGFSPVIHVEIPQVDRAKARLIVGEAVIANPKIAVALGVNDESMLATAHARMDRKGIPVFFVGGYVGHATNTIGFPFLMESCQFDGTFQELPRLAVRTLLARLQGEQVPDLVVLAPKFTRGRAKPWKEGDSYTNFVGAPKP